MRPERSVRWLTLFGMMTGLVAFGLHNLGDFDWYIPGLTVIAWVFMAVIINLSGRFREREIIISSWWLRGIIILLIFVVSSFALLNLERSLLGEYYHKEGIQAFRDKNYPLAEVTARVALKLDQKRPQTYYLLGRLAEANKDYLGAVPWYNRALEYNRNNASYWFRIAQAYRQHMQYANDYSLMSECEQGLSRAVALYPVSPMYHLHLGQYYESAGNFILALKEYQECLQLNNQLKAEHKKRGKLLKQMILPEKVIAELEKRMARLAKVAQCESKKSEIQNRTRGLK